MDLVAQDFLTDAEVERLREIEKLTEEIPEEESLRADAWEDLRAWGVTDLETLIQLSKERREDLAHRRIEAFDDYTSTTANFEAGMTEEEVKRAKYKWNASESVVEFKRTVFPLDAKIMRLRVRSEVAEELLDRHLLGYDIPETHPENPIVPPLSKYDPSRAASNILEAIAECQNERGNLRDAKDRTRVLRIALDDTGDDPLSPLRRDMKRGNVHGYHWPETVDELVNLAIQKTDLTPEGPNVS